MVIHILSAVQGLSVYASDKCSPLVLRKLSELRKATLLLFSTSIVKQRVDC